MKFLVEGLRHKGEFFEHQGSVCIADKNIGYFDKGTATSIGSQRSVYDLVKGLANHLGTTFEKVVVTLEELSGKKWAVIDPSYVIFYGSEVVKKLKVNS